ncbi:MULTISPECIES: hypothetical protein [unclassified Ensifer]|uniref:hypothetical protein n=1 Tax=unclassified Ensifer TaxID=2633371 RepID=UPI001146AE50|nr:MULTISPECIES: hypothetical protein [unclassified Ensifer]
MLKIAVRPYNEALHAEMSQGDDLSRDDHGIGRLIHSDRQDRAKRVVIGARGVELAFVGAGR